MLNTITVMGRLTRDPELRYTQSGTPVASFTVAVTRDYGPKGEEKETDFFDVVAWRHTGEFVSEYFTKGSMAVVIGRLEIQVWEDREGNKRRSPKIVAASVYFGESKRKQEGYPEGKYAASVSRQGYSAPDFSELPFGTATPFDEFEEDFPF